MIKYHLKSTITVIVFFILVFLGFWQIQRLEQKKSLITQFEKAINAEALKIGEIGDISNLKLYSKVIMEGKFLNDSDIHLYRHNPKNPRNEGYYLLTPFQIKTDTKKDRNIIIVVRGWFESSNKKLIKTEALDTQTITGITFPQERQGMFIPANNLQDNIWFTLNINEISRYFSINLPVMYLLEIDESNNAVNLPKLLEKPSIELFRKMHNDHLEYAITWFSLAIALAVIAFIRYKNEKSD